jgi:hypothetical protein
MLLMHVERVSEGARSVGAPAIRLGYHKGICNVLSTCVPCEAHIVDEL